MLFSDFCEVVELIGRRRWTGLIPVERIWKSTGVSWGQNVCVIRLLNTAMTHQAKPGQSPDCRLELMIVTIAEGLSHPRYELEEVGKKLGFSWGGDGVVASAEASTYGHQVHKDNG